MARRTIVVPQYDAARAYVVSSGGYQYGNPIVRFALNFLGRDWLSSGLKGVEALTFAQLMFSLYAVQNEGVLMSKKDAMRAIGAEHVATIKRYADLAVDLGMLRVEKSKLDERVQLLVLTEKGLAIIENELKIITQAVDWVQNAVAYKLNSDEGARKRAEAVESSITVRLPSLDELTLVADPLGGSRSGADPLKTNPKTFARWVNAYSETLRIIPNDIRALSSRAQYHWHTGHYAEALADYQKLNELQPDRWHGVLAEAFYENGNYRAAIEAITRHIEKTEDDFTRAHGHVSRGKYFAAQGDWRKVMDDLQAAEKAYPGGESSEWRRLRGLASAALGDHEQALADLQPLYEEALDMVKWYSDRSERGARAILSYTETDFERFEKGYVKDAAFLKSIIDQLEPSTRRRKKGQGSRETRPRGSA